jgi:hypothetical protein
MAEQRDSPCQTFGASAWDWYDWDDRPQQPHIDFWQKVEVWLFLRENILMQNMLGD